MDLLHLDNWFLEIVPDPQMREVRGLETLPDQVEEGYLHRVMRRLRGLSSAMERLLYRVHIEMDGCLAEKCDQVLKWSQLECCGCRSDLKVRYSLTKGHVSERMGSIPDEASHSK